MNDNIKLTKEWIKKAQDDLRNAEVLLKEGGTTDAICFHSQQAVEKYLKAFLVFHNLPVRKIHSLVSLAKECAKKKSGLLDFMKEYKTLEAYYIESRYPPDTLVYSENEGKTAYKIAVKVTGFINKLLFQ